MSDTCEAMRLSASGRPVFDCGKPATCDVIDRDGKVVAAACSDPQHSRWFEGYSEYADVQPIRIVPRKP